MKRKLKVNRETLRNLADQETQEAAGASGVLCNPSVVGSCPPQCTYRYSACVYCY